jgi:hypothetical protein
MLDGKISCSKTIFFDFAPISRILPDCAWTSVSIKTIRGIEQQLIAMAEGEDSKNTDSLRISVIQRLAV